MAGFELTAVYWPSVPTSPGGRQPTPQDRAAPAPGGDPSWRCSTAQARWQLMRHSGRRTRSPKFTGHCPGSGRPLGSINQAQSPPYTEERVPRVGHAMLTPRSPRIAVDQSCCGAVAPAAMGSWVLHCVVLAATGWHRGCGPLQRVAPLQRAATSGASTCSATESYAVATCAVATDCALVQQFCVVAMSAVATPDALLQRMSNCFGCVVARTC
jgi:hypothetical protein